MSRRLWKWDDIAHELVTADELDRRRSERAPKLRAVITAHAIERCHEIWDRQLGKPVPAAEYYARRANDNRSHLSAPMVMSDLEPYQAVGIDGRWISGRRQHRDELKARGLIEVGNEPPKPQRKTPMPDARRAVKDAIDQIAAGHKPAPVEAVSDLTA